MTRRSLPAPAEWAIRTCPETVIIDILLYWRFPPPALGGQFDAAHAALAEELAALRALGLPFETDGTTRLYDPCEAINFFICAGITGLSRYWQDVIAPSHLKMLSCFDGQPFDWSRPPDFSTYPARECHVDFDRIFHFEALAPKIRGYFKLPLPLQSEGQMRSLLNIQIDRATDYRQFENRAEFRLAPHETGPLHIGFSADLTLHRGLAREAKLTPSDLVLYTAPRENLIVISPAIAALSEELACGLRDPERLVERFFNHIMTSYIAGRIPYHAIDAQAPCDWPLAHGVFDCQIGSALLIALCRSQGIPARLIGGYQAYPGFHAPHFWSEIWLDGFWRPYDFGGWDAMMVTGDKNWGHAFAGQSEYRLVIEQYPYLCVGPSALPPKSTLHHIITRNDIRVSSLLCDARTMRPIIEDKLAMKWL